MDGWVGEWVVGTWVHGKIDGQVGEWVVAR